MGYKSFPFNNDLDAAVLYATLGGAIVGDRVPLAKPMGLNAVGLVVSLHEIVTNRVRPAL